MAAGESVSGRCLCGAVSFTATLKRAEMGVCHCGMCRRWTGGVFTYAPLDIASLNVSGGDSLRYYRSSSFGERGFCAECGSSLFWRAQDGGGIEVSAQALDDPSRLSFAEQIWMDDKPSNYDFADYTKTARRDEPPAFGESSDG